MAKNRTITVQDVPITITQADIDDSYLYYGYGSSKVGQFKGGRCCEKLVEE